MKYLLKINTFFRNLSTFNFILIMTFLSFIILIPFYPILNFLNSLSKNPLAGPITLSHTLVYKISVGCLLAPIFETLIFQTFIISELKKIKNKNLNNNIAIILISALFFGLSHYYNIRYIFLAFIVGIILAYSYILYENKTNSPFWVVAIIHALRNFATLAMTYL